MLTLFLLVVGIVFILVMVDIWVLDPIRAHRDYEVWYAAYRAEQQNPDLPPTYNEWTRWYARQRVQGLPTERRVSQPVIAIDPQDHPFEDLHFSKLYEHMFEKHFETWSVVAEMRESPNKWRREHAADHGYKC